MRKRLRKRLTFTAPRVKHRNSVLIMLFASFLIGSLLHLAFPSGAVLFNAELQNTSLSPFLQSVVDAILFPIILFFASTSLFGVCISPICAALQGYFLTSASSSFYFQYPNCGWLYAILYIGLPVFLYLPCLFCLGADAFFSSVLLLKTEPRSGRFSGPMLFIKHLLVFLPFILARVAIENVFMPQIIGLMID